MSRLAGSAPYSDEHIEREGHQYTWVRATSKTAYLTTYAALILPDPSTRTVGTGTERAGRDRSKACRRERTLQG